MSGLISTARDEDNFRRRSVGHQAMTQPSNGYGTATRAEVDAHVAAFREGFRKTLRQTPSRPPDGPQQTMHTAVKLTIKFPNGYLYANKVFPGHFHLPADVRVASSLDISVKPSEVAHFWNPVDNSMTVYLEGEKLTHDPDMVVRAHRELVEAGWDSQPPARPMEGPAADLLLGHPHAAAFLKAAKDAQNAMRTMLHASARIDASLMGLTEARTPISDASASA